MKAPMTTGCPICTSCDYRTMVGCNEIAKKAYEQ